MASKEFDEDDYYSWFSANDIAVKVLYDHITGMYEVVLKKEGTTRVTGRVLVEAFKEGKKLCQ